MNYIDIHVVGRHATNVTYTTSGGRPVCGNTDYTIRFTFDAEWESIEHKTARFRTESGYTDVLFIGNECPMPMFSNVLYVEVGVYAGDLQTSTPAYIPIDRSILCGETPPHPDPPEDIYNQIIARLEAIEYATVSPEAIEKAVSDYLEENPVETGVQFTTDETLNLSEDSVLSVNRADEVEQDNTLPITSAAVYETVGNINALLATI